MKLRDYQEDISNKACELLKDFKIAYLAMEVRTGKTITALETVRKYGAKDVLFVTKKKAISSINNDAELFPDLSVVTINFESVHKIEAIGGFDIVVVDEAHCIGAFPKPSKRAKELKDICLGLPIIYLSGTPTPESYSQMFHQFWVSSYSPFKQYINFYKWAVHFVNKEFKYLYNRQVNDYSNARISKIEELTKHLFISYTQKQAGFDNTIHERTLYVDMDQSIKTCCDMLLKDNIIVGKTATVIADTAVKLQSKIHQICSGTVINEDGETIIISKTKALFIRDYFKGKKIAVYYKFKGEFQVLSEVFENWTSDPMEFQESKDKVFLGQFVSSREGIRLDTADSIIFYNIDFSYLSYEQAKNRIVSKERIKEAVLYWIFTKGGIESRIYKAVCNKKDYTNYYFKSDYGVKNTRKNKAEINKGRVESN